ncbi:MAG: NAD(P)-dependent oxidoreductase [Planctomycetaceae bacterium]|nr:NAD(P)-dependent oxidoreductase [Planctomycetaceae bacterium]
MKILVTGANGFVGRHVLNALRTTSHEIIATSRGEKCVMEDIPYVTCDLNEEKNNFFQFFGSPDAVIHLAWEGLPNYNALFHIERNLETSYRFLKQMIESGTRNITVIGTCFEYGLQNGCLSEDLPPKPNTTYAVAKNILRIFLEELQKRTPFDFKWIRLFYLYGEGQNKNSILEQLKTALQRDDKIFNMSGGEQLRDYLPVETVAENIVKIALQNKIQGIVNNASGKPISIRRFVEEFLHQEGKNIALNLGYYPYATYEPMAFWGDIQKLQMIIQGRTT